MARDTNVFSPNTYAGELYETVAWPALLPPKGLVDAGLVTPVPGIKKRAIMRTINENVVFQDPSCSFNGTANTNTFGEKYLDPVKYEVQKEICWADFLVTWESEKMKKASKNDYQPIKSVEDGLLEYILSKVGIMNEQLYINGKTGLNNGGVGTATFTAPYPGLLERLRDDSSVIKLSSTSAQGNTAAISAISIANPGVVTTATAHGLSTGQRVTIASANGSPYVNGKSVVGQTFVITVLTTTTFSLGAQTTGGTASTSGTYAATNSGNAITLLTSAYQNIPQAVRGTDGSNIWVSRDIAEAYRLAQASVANGAGNYYADDKKLTFLGMPLVEVDYLPSNTILVANKSNIRLGFDADGDDTEIRSVYLGDATLDDIVRYKMSMKTDINYVFGNEILLITPLTTSTES